MKTCEIKDAFGIDALKFSERPDPPLPYGQVRIRVRAVSLNYRDLVTVKHGGACATRLPLIPCHPGLTAVYRVGAYHVATRLVHCRAGREARDARAAYLRVR